MSFVFDATSNQDEDPRIDIPLSDFEDAVISAANSALNIVVAAGNDAVDANKRSPARVNHTYIRTVSAFREGDEFVQDFDETEPNCDGPNLVGSNFANPPVDYTAPGEKIRSLLTDDNGSIFNCGTSFAAPYIAGLLLAVPDDVASGGFVTNDPDGQADQIVVFNPFGTAPGEELTVSIEGPQRIFNGESGEYSVSISNPDATSPFDYLWNITLQNCKPSKDCTHEDEPQFAGNESTLTVSYDDNFESVKIEVWVTDADDREGQASKSVSFDEQKF